MPLWYGLALLLIVGAAFEHRPIAQGSGLLLASAAARWAATIVVTIAILVPRNNRIAKLDPDRPTPDGSKIAPAGTASIESE